jgi:phosphoribosylanthranilate isomerase
MTREEDALRAAALGADFLGFIFHPESPRFVSPLQAAAISSPGVKRVGVFVRQGGGEILEIMEEARLDYAQFHGEQTIKDAEKIGRERVIRVLWPDRFEREDDFLRGSGEWKDRAALFLLDSGLKGGGSGAVIGASASPWFKKLGRPYLLAGGMNPGKLSRLWPSLDPMLKGFDLNSGVESAPGVKDRGLMAEAARLLGKPPEARRDAPPR